MICHSYKEIAFIGAGCYGTAVAQCLSNYVDRVVLLSHSTRVEQEINKKHLCSLLGNAPLNSNIICCTAYTALKSAELVFITVPARAVVSVSTLIRENSINAPLVLCSKGVDVEQVCLISETISNALNNELLIFSGPSFANEVIRGLPFGVNIAGKNKELAREVARRLTCKTCMVSAIDDYIGLQIAGAFKNILAIGCGIKRGEQLGNNSIAQLIVEGVKEMAELTAVMGGKRETFFELGGIGDIMLTCTGSQSRNGQFGEFVARGGNLSSWNGPLTEGVYAAKAIPGFIRKYKVQMRIFKEVYDKIYDTQIPNTMQT